MINKILRYHSIIILLYEFILLIFFWIFTKFIFQNNISILLVSLMTIPPIVLYLFYFIKRKENIKKFNDVHSNYFQLIKRDIKNNQIDDLLIKPLKEYLWDLTYKVTDQQVYLNGGKKNKISILIEENLTTLLIDNTKIVYQYLYDYKGIDVTKYDYKGLGRYPTKKLYALLVKQVKELYNQNLIYTEFYQGKKCTGYKLEGTEIIYLINNSEKKILKKVKENQINIYI